MGVVIEFPSDNLAKYDEVYHCKNCSCGSGSKWVSVSEFIIECLYPRQQEGKFKKEIGFGGGRYQICQPPRKSFIDRTYSGTDLDDNEERYPILCSEGHLNWEEGSPKTPSSMHFISDYPYTELKRRIERGDSTFGGSHFKHFQHELPTCLCGGNVLRGNQDFLTRRRDDALSEHLDVEMCISSTRTNGFIDKWELRFFNHDSGQLLNPDEINSSTIIQGFSTGKASFWLKQNERRMGRLPFHCARHITNESVKSSSRQIKIPDTGELVVIIPESRIEEYKNRLKSLKYDPDEEHRSFSDNEGIVKLFNRKAVELNHQGRRFHVATIKWSSSSLPFIREFMKKSTGLESQFVRTTKPVKIELYDDDNELITVADANYPNRYRCDAGSSMKVRVFRSRNSSLHSFLLNIGPNVNIDLDNLNPVEFSIREHPPNHDGSKLIKIFVKSSKFQQGIWFDLYCDKADDGTWFEVFDDKTSVEASGMRVEFFEGD